MLCLCLRKQVASKSSWHVGPCSLLTHFSASAFSWICIVPVPGLSLALFHLPVMTCYLFASPPSCVLLAWFATCCSLLSSPDLVSASTHMCPGGWFQTCLCISSTSLTAWNSSSKLPLKLLHPAFFSLVNFEKVLKNMLNLFLTP